MRTGLVECWSNGVMRRFRVVATLLLTLGVGFWLAQLPADAQDVRAKAEAEGKLMMYATFTAADSKTLVDGFKQLYPKIDAAYYRSTDSAMMERYRHREPRRSESLRRDRDDQFLRPQLEKARTVRGIRLTGAQILPRGLQRSAGELDVDLYELWRVWLQHTCRAKVERAEIFQRSIEARVERADRHGKPPL